jgi:hypothetical protein
MSLKNINLEKKQAKKINEHTNGTALLILYFDLICSSLPIILNKTCLAYDHLF